MKANVRSWHTWLSVLLAVPIVLVSATAILIAHSDDLGTKKIEVAPPGASMSDRGDYELKSYLKTEAGTEFYGTKYGLAVKAPGAAPLLASELGATEVRDLATADGTAYAATKMGLWRLGTDDKWTKVAAGDFWTVSVSPGVVRAVAKDAGLVESRDAGLNFAPVPSASEALTIFAAQTGAPPYTLNKLVMDIHTGKLFFGKEYEWLWIDLLGGVMVFLTISGLIMWRRAEKRKAALASKSSLHASSLEGAVN